MNRTDLIVVGAGPAGMSAAIEAAKRGAHVTVLDENSRPGGQLFKQIHKFFGSKEHHAKVRGFVIGEELMEEAARLGVDVRLDSTVIGLYQDKEVVVREGEEVSHHKADAIVIATGAAENMVTFEGWTLPGVIGASLGGGEWWLRASVLFYILAALIRLAYFNVTEEERQSATNEHRHYYLGVPVTAASFVMPLFWALPLRLGSAPAVIYAVGLTLLAFLFITPLRVPKPGLKGILCMILLGTAELYLMFYGAMPL